MIFHVTTRADWSAAHALGKYVQSTRGRSLAEVGFIHCSDAHQVARIANLLYAAASDVVVLTISVEHLDAVVRYENLDGGAELFPHIYGPLPFVAVTSVDALEPGPDGVFKFP